MQLQFSHTFPVCELYNDFQRGWDKFYTILKYFLKVIFQPFEVREGPTRIFYLPLGRVKV